MKGGVWSVPFRYTIPAVACGLLQVALWTNLATAGVPHLVADINQKIIPVDSHPQGFFDQSSYSVLTANDGPDGLEPWITDGTSAGTFMWGHVGPPKGGVTGEVPVQAGGRSFILYQDLSQQFSTIWVSDGTPAGSYALSPLSVASAGVNGGIAGNIGSKAVLTFFNTRTGRRDLWVSDGTDAGTQQVLSASGDPFSVTAGTFVNGRLYFISGTDSSPRELWVTDGTTAGTNRIARIRAGDPTALLNPTAVGHYLLFSANLSREVWSFDITSNTLTELADVSGGDTSQADLAGFWAPGNRGVAVFAVRLDDQQGVKLWRTDGTPAGTYVITTAPQAQFVSPIVSNSTALLLDLSTATASQIWATDGTSAGTQLISDGSYLGYQISGRFYFWHPASPVLQLWTTDGTAGGTHVLAGLPAIPSGASAALTGAGDTLFIRSDIGLYRYDVTAATATKLASLTFDTQSAPSGGVFTYARGKLYFDNEDPVHGRELWTSERNSRGRGVSSARAAPRTAPTALMPT